MGIVLEIPELEPVIGDLRAEHDWTAQAGAPAHVTLVGGTNFVGPTNAELLSIANRIGAAISEVHRFPLRFERTGRYPGALILPVEESATLRALTSTISEACGVEARPTFHATVARAAERVLQDAEHRITAHLPLDAVPSRVLLVGGDGGGSAQGVLATWNLAT